MKRRRWKRKYRRKLEAPDVIDLAERARGLDQSSVLDMMDVTVSNLNQYIREYRQTRNIDYLGELNLSAQAIYAMANELLLRSARLKAVNHYQPPNPSGLDRQGEITDGAHDHFRRALGLHSCQTLVEQSRSTW